MIAFLRLPAAALTAVVAGAVAEPSVAVGRDFSFIVPPDSGPVLAMGSNSYGQLGVDAGGDEEQKSPVPVRVPEGAQVASVAAGAFHSLLLLENGTVMGTGRNNHGQLGDGSLTDRKTPVQVLDGVKAVAAGYAHSLFLLQDGTVLACGLNNAGQLGNGNTSLRASPLAVEFSEGAPVLKQVAAGYDFSYFLAETGEVWAVGMNLGGQLGDGSREIRTRPVKVSLDRTVAAVAAGTTHALFLGENGVVYATGANYAGQLGDNTSEPAKVPREALGTLGTTREIFGGGESSCSLRTRDGGVACWGSNAAGQLGLGAEVNVFEPTDVWASGFERAALGEAHSLFAETLAEGGKVFASGANEDGQLGDGSTDARRMAVEVYSPPATATATSTVTATGTATATTTEGIAVSSTATTTTTATATSTRGSSAGPEDGWSRSSQVWMVSAGIGVVLLLISGILNRGIVVDDVEDSGFATVTEQELATPA